MDRIRDQAAKFWQTLSAPETLTTYQEAGAVTWRILQELGLLLWLVLCLGLVAVDWFWKNSIQAGRNFRYWLSGLEQPSPERIASEAGKAIVSVGKGSFDYTIAQARGQLGLPLQLEIPEREPVSVRPTSAPVSASAPEPAPIPSPTPAPEPLQPQNLDPLIPEPRKSIEPEEE